MSDETNTALGGNAAADLKRRVDRRVDLLERMAEHADEMKTYKAEDKADGFTERAISKVVKEKRSDADQILANLTLETEVRIYRETNDLPTTIEAAQKLAGLEAASLPDKAEKKKGKSKRGGFN